MLSWLYILQGIGMMAVGAGAIAYWRLKKHVALRFYAYGAALWAAAIAIKLIMDFTVTQPFISALSSTLPAIAVAAVISLYLGLRTGILESGITYMAVKKTSLARSTFDEAVALGIGFGGAEAIILGAYSLISTVALLQSYQTLGLLSPVSPDIQALLNMAPAIVERASMLACHVFATVLAAYAVKPGQLWWLYASIAFKTIIDGSIIPFKYILGVDYVWPIELFYVALACIGLVGLYWIKKRCGEHAPKAGPEVKC